MFQLLAARLEWKLAWSKTIMEISNWVVLLMPCVLQRLLE
jgi:hypothetical protein